MFFFAFSPRLGIINVVIGFRLVSHTPAACLIVISDGLIKRMESRISACVHTCCFFFCFRNRLTSLRVRYHYRYFSMERGLRSGPGMNGVSRVVEVN